jgi:hypothetical protein
MTGSPDTSQMDGLSQQGNSPQVSLTCFSHPHPKQLTSRLKSVVCR